jgi:hypothetical protein
MTIDLSCPLENPPEIVAFLDVGQLSLASLIRRWLHAIPIASLLFVCPWLQVAFAQSMTVRMEPPDYYKKVVGDPRWTVFLEAPWRRGRGLSEFSRRKCHGWTGTRQSAPEV